MMNMSLKFLLPLLLLASSACAKNSLDIEDIVSQQRYLMRLMIQTYSANAVSERAAVDIDSCFTYYTNKQDTIMETYGAAHKGCINVAEEMKREISRQNDEKREEVLTSTHAVCDALGKCDNVEDGLEFFECSYESADANYGILYGISVDSKDRVNELKIRYQQIDFEQNQCTNKAYNIYISELDQSNKDLQKCLRGEIVPPTDTSSSSSSSTTTTTVAPATTETEPQPQPEPEPTTTVAPETTETETQPQPEPEPTTTVAPETTETETQPEPELTTEKMPEEDLGFRVMPMRRFSPLNLLRPL